MCFRPSKAKSKNIKVCPKCGAKNSPDAKNCAECGASLDGATPDLPPIASPQTPDVASSVIPGINNLPPLSVDYPELPGASAIRTNLIGSSMNDAALWRFLKKGVVARKDHVDCWYESPVTALIQDPETHMIVGVEIERAGKKVHIAARKGVVMTLGGYENSPSCTQQFLDLAKTLPVGTLYNEGDGMRMAQAAGARMWHTNAWESSGVGLAPEHDRTRNSGDISFFKQGSVILVGGDARRYIAEDLEQRHGKVLMGGTWITPSRPDANYFIFDEAQRLAMEKGALPRPFPNWSHDLTSEVAAGTVVKSDTVQGVAVALSLDAAALQATIDSFSKGAAAGIDALGRKPEHMSAFSEGPYYGVAVFPSVRVTQGGPERSAKAEVLDADGNPLAHLYAAGEFGSITARCSQGGGNLSECVVFGAIAGQEAAAHEDGAIDVPSAELSYGPGSGDESVYDQAPDETNLAADEVVGVGEGIGGPLWVKVSSYLGIVYDIEVLRHTEHADIGAKALDDMIQRMLAARAAEVDVVAGATVTSLGMIQAVENALEKTK